MKINIEVSKSKNYQTYKVGFEEDFDDVDNAKEAEEKTRKLQELARKLVEEQIELDEANKPIQEDKNAIKTSQEQPKSKSKSRIGALWINKDSTINGNILKNKVEFTIDQFKNKFESKETPAGIKYYSGDMFEKQIRIYENRYKKEETHPDFVVYEE